tara:strand:+ start:47331 stop:48344 length:1014 start_codon:yes stop_codon:yes gene_type:complete
MAIVGGYFLFLVLIKAKVFFAPLVTAGILALLLLPLSQYMEHKINRVLASLLNTCFLLVLTLGMVTLFSFQIKNFMNDWPQIKKTIEPTLNKTIDIVNTHTPLEKEDFKIGQRNGLFSFLNTPKNKPITIIDTVIGYLGSFLLTFIYTFFLLNYRSRFKKCLLLFFSREKRKKVGEIISSAAKIAPQYLLGRLILIGFLSLLYSLGLGISGVDNFILISIIAAIFSLIPYIGNIVGVVMAIVLGYLGTGDTTILVGIVVTFSIAQFIESYVLEPYVVGDKVDVHPFIVILAVVVGNLIWGVIGMIIAIPIIAIIALILLHIPVLKPLGILFSNKNFK